MATASVTYTFSAASYAKASEVNTNFADLVSFLNNSVVHKDGSVAMTGALTLSGAPSTASHAATKSYVDGKASFSAGTVDLGSKALSSTTMGLWGTEQTVTNPGAAVGVLVWINSILYCSSSSGEDGQIAAYVSFDNGSTYTNNTAIYGDTSTGNNFLYFPISCHYYKTGTPTGDIKIKAMAAARSTTGASLQTGLMTYFVFRT